MENLDYKTLLDLSRAVNTVRDAEDLLRVMMSEVRPLFRFTDVGIFVLDREGKRHRDLSVVFPGITPSIGNEKLNAAGLGIWLPHRGSLIEHHIESCKRANAPLVFTFAEMLAEFPDYPFLKIAEPLGYQDYLATLLKVRGETIGVLYFNSLEAGFFKQSQYTLFQAVADQVAVAVANIINNEEILEREREKSVLLSISQAIATIQNTEQLFKVIFERIQPLFGFYDVGLFVLSKDGKQITDWAAESPEISPSLGNQQVHQQQLQTFSLADSPLQLICEELVKVGSPQIFRYDEGYLNLIYDTDFRAKVKTIIETGGYREFLATPLKTGGKTLGLLFFNAKTNGFFEPGKFGLFQAVADQIAVSVANILANEEILKREREKSKLLSISREIATVQTRKQLLNVIFTTIKDIFPYDDAGLFYFCDASGKPNPNGAYYVHLLDDLISEVNIEIAEQNITGVLQEGIEAVRFAAQDQSSITTLDQLIEEFPGYPFYSIMERDGIRQFITKGIKIGGETIGMLSFNSRRENFYSKDNFPLFDNIVNQVAVAVANILANEEILERAREKSVLLSISEDIASARNAVELMQVIREKAQKLIPFYDTGLLIVEDDSEHHYDLAVNLIGWDESESNQQLQTLNLSRIVHPNSYVEFAMQLIETANGPIIEDYEQRYKEFDYPFFKIMQESGIKQAIAGVLKSGGKTFGTLWLNSLEKNHFKPEQLGIFQALADQVAVAVSNILKNQEIIEREREKSVLLSLSEAIANIRDKNELWRVMMEKVQPLLGFKVSVSTVYSADYSQYCYFLFSGILTDNLESDSKNHFSHYLPIAGTSDEWILQQPDVYAMTIEEKETIARGNPEAIKILKSIGIKYNLYIKLRSAGKIVGVQHYHFESSEAVTEKTVSLAKSITDLIATAVANILANEEIIRLAEDRRQQAEKLAKSNAALARTSSYLVNQPDLSAFLSQVVLEAANQLSADAGHLIILDEKSGMLRGAALVQSGQVADLNLVAREMPVAENDFFQILRETRQPRFFDLNVEADLFRRDIIAYHRKHSQKAVFVVPLIAGENLLGILGLAFTDTTPVSERQIELMTALAHQAALAIQLTRLADEARREAEATATLEERNRIAREIHDTLAQGFTGVIVQLETAKRVFDTNTSSKIAQFVERSIALAREGLAEARRSVQALRPSETDLQINLANLLRDKLESLIADTTVEARVTTSGTPFPLRQETAVNLLRIGQEAFTNALRHSGAAKIEIALDYANDNRFCLRISDNGNGFDTKLTNGGYGLRGMRERAASINADLEIASQSEKGTQITVKLNNCN